MAIIHVVLFEFKPSTNQSQIEDACKRMVDNRNRCVHPTTKKPYITSLTGGKQNSIEHSNEAGYTHAFVVEFASEEDRKYYVEEDQAHLDFKKIVRPLTDRVGVMDYTPGEY